MYKYYYAFLFYIILLQACSPTNVKETRTVFRYNEIGGLTSLDPAAARRFEEGWAVGQLYNGLIQLNDSLRPEPCIAKRYTISSDALTYTFYLRNDVFFHDTEVFPNNRGRRVVAGDFVYSFNRLLDPKISSAISLLAFVKQPGGFEAPNDTTFIINLTKPFTPFLAILSMKYFSVIPKEAIDKYGEDFRRNPVGTGPFKFKIWDEGNKMVLLKNNNYFEFEGASRLPYLDAVAVSFIKDKETSFLKFLKGDLEMVSGVDAINTDEVLTPQGTLKDKYQSTLYMQAQPFLKTDYLGFYIDDSSEIVKASPLKLKAIRKAINYGFDRTKMLMFLRKNIGIPAKNGFLPPSLASVQTTPTKGFVYDPDVSRKLLHDAGYPNGRGLPAIVLSTTEQFLELSEYIQSQLADVGIKVKIDVQRPPELSEAVANGKVNFFRKSWVADYPDEENFLSVFYSKNFAPKGANYTHYKNAAFDELYEKSQSEVDTDKRYAYYREMDKLIIEDAPIVPVFYDQVVRLVQKRVKGLTSNPMNMLDLKKVKLIN